MSGKIRINNTDLWVSRINLGTNVFGWTLDERKAFQVLDAFTGAGFNFIDTADMYTCWVDGKDGGQSETIIGNWLRARGNRKDMVIATKVGGATGAHGIDISRRHILDSIDKSLKRLQTDYLDLYYTHFDDRITPVEETLAAYGELIKAGKVRYIAASNISPERLAQSFIAAETIGLPKYVSLQPHYNLLARTKYENEYLPLVEKYGLTVFPYWSLAEGFLTGKYRTKADLTQSVRGAGIKKYLNEEGLGVIKVLDNLAAKHGAQQGTIALAWLLAQPNIGAPIASATTPEQLNVLLNAPGIVLDKEDLQQLDIASKKIEVN